VQQQLQQWPLQHQQHQQLPPALHPVLHQQPQQRDSMRPMPVGSL
jgi:hypothetical protein